MNNTHVKLLILALAIASAICGVLLFIQTVVSPPDDIKTEDVYSSDLLQLSNSFTPDSQSLFEAEKSLDAIIDRAILYKGDGFIEQEVYDDAIAQSSEKFSTSFIKWSMSKFNQRTWEREDHALMKRIIKKLRNITIAQGSKKALEQKSLEALTEIEGIINEYESAWEATKQISFVPWDYDDAYSKRTIAENYAKNKYLKNCESLVNSLNSVGERLENSCYDQLTKRVTRLQFRYLFNSKEDYDKESSHIYDLIQAYEKTSAFGFSTFSHAKVLKDLQDSYDRDAADYNWPDTNL